MSADVQSPVFVGRQAEMASLAVLMNRALDGESAFALVGGEAGVGKTRLAGELVTLASGSGFTVLVGHCIELGAEGLPLAPLVDALRALARTAPPGELAGLLGPGRYGLARLLPELAPDAAVQVPAEGIQTAQLLELVLGLLTRLSASRPVLLVLEDLHWADQSTLELAAFLVRSLRDVRVLLVGTYRSDELHRRHPLRPLLISWERVRSVGRIDLRRFNRDEVGDQLAVILADEPSPDDEPHPDLVDLIFDRSGGNAYLVEELAAVMRDGGDPADLPPSLRDLLLSRADSLSTDARRLLRTASIAGRRVPDRLLAEVADISEPELFDALRETVEGNLLVVDRTGHGYEFRHALTRDAVYEDMLPGERVRLHAAYGAALGHDPGLADDDASVPAALAHHWYAALDLPRALPASIAAASHALTSFAPAEAQRHLERALEIWPRVPDAHERTGLDQVEVTRLAADAAYLAGDVGRSLSLLDQALTDLPAEGDAVRRALLMNQRAHAMRDTGREAEAITSLEQALALLPDTPVNKAHAVVLGSLAASLMRIGGMPRAMVMAERAVHAARTVGAVQEEADAFITLGLARAYLGSGAEGLDDLRAGLALALDADAPATALRGYVNLSDVLGLLGRHAEAAQVASDGISLASAAGRSRTFGAYLTGNLAEPLLRLGRWAEADRLTAQALSALPEGIFAVTLLQLRAELAAMSGRYEDAAAELSAARRAVGHSTDAQFVQPMLYADAIASLGRGDLAAARDKVAAGLAVIQGPLSVRYAWPLLWLAMRIEADEATRARDHREHVPGHSTARCHELTGLAAGLTISTPSDGGYQALVAAEQARAIASDEPGTWSAAVAAWRVAAEPYPLAYALLRLAEVQCTVGNRRQAAGNVQQAHEIASQLGAAPIAGEAAALARRARLVLDAGPVPATVLDDGAAAKSSPGSDQNASRPATGPADAPAGRPAAEEDELARFGLTEREREVLLLLAAGRSNSQIAHALFISPKTASVHVSNILAKLGVHGRVEAAAVAHRLGAADRPPTQADLAERQPPRGASARGPLAIRCGAIAR
jgi:DNA-binding CsgD family transcriptional regulator/tetratricopeptide (TPR) repeat protein